MSSARGTPGGRASGGPPADPAPGPVRGRSGSAACGRRRGGAGGGRATGGSGPAPAATRPGRRGWCRAPGRWPRRRPRCRPSRARGPPSRPSGGASARPRPGPRPHTCDGSLRSWLQRACPHLHRTMRASQDEFDDFNVERLLSSLTISRKDRSLGCPLPPATPSLETRSEQTRKKLGGILVRRGSTERGGVKPHSLGPTTMASTQLSAVLRLIRKARAQDDPGEPSDQGLLERFVTQRDAAAFEALLARHGPMVWDVCRRLLPDPNAAEDAFQATFLVLVHKAGSIRKGELLGNWLYGVAYRTAARAKVEAARRRAREGAAPSREPADPLAAITARELVAVLDEELSRLPSRYRAPMILCYLEGRTRDQAARHLGCSVSTLDRRLEHGRGLLRARLVRRGVALSVTLIPALLSQGAASARVPPALLASTGRAAASLLGGKATAAGVVSAKAASLAEGVLRTMLWKQVMALAVAFAAAGLIAVAGGELGYQVVAGGPG